MAKLSKENKDKLFQVPVLRRDEPEVIAAEIESDQSSQLKKNENALREFAKEITSLLEGYSLLAKDYQKLIDILVTRANMLGIKLNPSDYPDDQSLSNALVTIYGTATVGTITFQEYVDLLKYEQTTAGAYVATTVNLENAFDDVDELLKNGLAQNPIVGAIGVIKEKFYKEISDSGYTQLNLTDILVQRLAEAQSSISSASETNKLADGELATDKVDSPADKNKQSKLDKALQDCIPCLDRSFGIAEDFKKGDLLQVYVDLMFEKLFANLKELIRLKLSIAGTYFSQDICQIISLLGNYTCVPDLMAILTLLKSMMMNFKRLLEVEFKSLSIGLPAAPMGAFVNAGLDALVMLITKVFSTIFSSLECVLMSLQIQLSKLGISVDLGADDVRSAGNDFYSTLRKGKADLEAQFYALIEQITKKLRINIFGTGQTLDIMDQLNQVSSYVSLVTEILNTKKAFDNLTGSDWDRLRKGICVAAYSGNHPWLDLVDDWIDGYSDDDGSDDGSGDGDDDDGGGVIIADDSLPDDLFEDDPVDLLDNDYWREYWRRLGYRYDPENGDDIIQLDEDLLNKYNTTKSQLMRTHTALKARGSLDGRSALPVIRLDFSKCLEANDIQDFSASEINEWINKINS